MTPHPARSDRSARRAARRGVARPAGLRIRVAPPRDPARTARMATGPNPIAPESARSPRARHRHRRLPVHGTDVPRPMRTARFVWRRRSWCSRSSAARRNRNPPWCWSSADCPATSADSPAHCHKSRSRPPAARRRRRCTRNARTALWYRLRSARSRYRSPSS